MKSNIIISVCLFICGLYLVNTAKADDLFYEDTCMPSYTSSNINYVEKNFGVDSLSCDNISAIKNATNVIGIALMPVYAALNAPGVKGALISELAALGLTVSGPAVLGVTVIGSVGTATFYIVMKKTMDDCDREAQDKLRADILRELESRYNLNSSTNVPLKVVH